MFWIASYDKFLNLPNPYIFRNFRLGNLLATIVKWGKVAVSQVFQHSVQEATQSL